MEIKITIPSDASEIRLSQHLRWLKETKDIEDEHLKEKKLVAICCNLDEDLVNKIPRRQFKEIVLTLVEALGKKYGLVRRFKLDGVEYGFIPKLEDITVGEQADLDAYFKSDETYDKAMAILYRPITSSRGSTYLIEEYEADGRSLDVPMNVVNGAISFFLTLQKILENYTLNSIQSMVERQKKPKHSEKNGDGIKKSMPLQEET